VFEYPQHFDNWHIAIEQQLMESQQGMFVVKVWSRAHEYDEIEGEYSSLIEAIQGFVAIAKEHFNVDTNYEELKVKVLAAYKNDANYHINLGNEMLKYLGSIEPV
jgi:hypothetical protein